MKFLQIIIVSLMSLLLVSSCGTSQKINKYNSADAYVNDFPDAFMQYQIYHLNDSLSELFIRIDAAKIPSLQSKQLDVYSLMRLTFGVYSSMNKKDMLQSASYKLSDFVAYKDLDNTATEIRIPLKIKQNNSYVLIWSLQDQVNKRNYYKLLRLEKNKNSSFNIRFLNADNQLIWKKWLEPNDQVRLQYRYGSVNELVMDYYKPKFSPGLPPYMEAAAVDNNQVFEQHSLSLENGISSLVQPPKKGVYAIRSSKDELCVASMPLFYKDFALDLTPAQKVFSLRYLNNRKEFGNMLKDEPAHTIKEFWFFEGRSKERSQKMMKTYYDRTIRANALFSGYKEGWKTDRGMIFMIYGPPDVVYQEIDREVWEYGDEAAYNDLRFEFVRKQSKYNTQEFILIRDQDYKKSWYKVVENWRSK
ncbi:MAG: hypothetical protein B7C24_03105 [Bacteroidetes bacterium 4572_77]|nr:MAG: hypothetical protein B7C24_03105 [Bacteroidetes bacterium 4572_77]